MTTSQTIAVLPPEVISKLRSCVAITSVSQCVEELALNAVDSGAKNVAVRLDLTYFKIQVVDNGCGITRDQLEVIGERYYTSKCHDVEDLQQLRFHGFRGEALASLRDICAVIEITSRTAENQSYFKAFHYGKNSQVKLSTDERPSVGTTVTILDFMYNMPVRRKSICSARDFEFSRYCLEAIALINPHVSFTLRNDQSGEVCLNTKRSNNILSSFRFLFGPDKILKELAPNSVDDWRIQGVISLDGHTTNELQFIYVNNRLVLKTRLHQLVRLVLGKSLFSRNRDTTSNYSPDISSSPKKAGNPIFVLNIICPFEQYDICFEPRKTLIEFQDWDKVTNVVQDTLRTFLKGEGLDVESEERSPLKVSGSNLCSDTIKVDTLSKDSTGIIDTTNTKNALFSLIIKRPSEAGNVKLGFSEENHIEEVNEQISEQDTTTEKTLEAFQHSLNTNLNIKNTENLYNKSKHSDDITTFPNSKLLKKQSCALSDISTKESIASTSTSIRTIPKPMFFPVALRFTLKPSPLSLLSNRKIKENKLDEIRTSFQYQKRSILNRGSEYSGKFIETCSANTNKKAKHTNSDCKQPTGSKPTNEQTTKINIKSISVESLQSREKNVNILKNMNKLSEHKNIETVEKIRKTCLTVSETVTQVSVCDRIVCHEDGISASEPFIVTQPFSIHDVADRACNSRTISQVSELPNKILTLDTRRTDSRSETDSFDLVNTIASKMDGNPPLDMIMNSSILTDDTDIPLGQKSPTVFLSEQLETINNTTNNNFDYLMKSIVASSSEMEELSKSSKIYVNQPEDINLRKYPEPNQETSLSSDFEKGWFQWLDHDSGAILYIDKATGNSSYNPPVDVSCNKEEESLQSNVSENGAVGSHFFLSHNSTPFLPRPERKMNASEKNEEETEVSRLLKAWENPVFKRTDFTELTNADHRNKSSIQAYNIIQNYKFFKSMFDKALFLGQVDCKFLACLVPSTPESSDPDLLILFDQHAVHERIRLEQFIKELYSHKGEVRTAFLQPPMRLEVSAEYMRLSRAFSSQLEKSGLGVEPETGHGSSNVLRVRCVPTCLSEREASELKNSRPSILASLAQTLLEEQLLKMKETGSVGGSIPKTIFNVLSSRACKGAIKFGDPLEKTDCIQLIKHLSNCQLPFQCAHGRPSAIPIMDMAQVRCRLLEQKITPPRLFRLRGKQSKELM